MMKVVNLSRVGLKTLVPPVPTCEKHTYHTELYWVTSEKVGQERDKLR